MERRVLLAISLSFLVLFLFQRFVLPPPVPQNESAPAPAAASEPGSTTTPAVTGAAASAAPASSAPGSPASPEAPATAVTIGEPAAREVVIETAKVRAVFTNKGARLVHWILKEYRNDNGTPLDLVPAGAGSNPVRPFTITVDDQALSARINDALYKVTVNGGPAAEMVDATGAAQAVVFEAAGADGLMVRKTFTLEPRSYVVSMNTLVQMGSQRLNPVIHWGPGLGDEIARAKPASFFSPSYNTPAQPVVHKDGKLQRITATTAGMQDGSIRYGGITDHYFVSMVLNEGGTQPLRVEYVPVSVPQTDDPQITGHFVDYSVRFQAPTDDARFFFGPKEFETLRDLDPETTRIINFGIFSFLAAPLLTALKWVHGFIGNWGWAIIVLTILINLVLFPLRHKSVVSMRKMQEIQPQMKAIQDRYAKYKVTDPERQKMNTEVMELYKAKGVNPASGCLPTLLTFPFLFAFYGMLSQSIEIRGADFAGWVHNLSAPDPYFILPLVFGAIQIYQMKITPTAGDPAQQKVMMVMPVMFTFMSLNFPSGLVVYWLVSTVLTILQQQVTTKITATPAKARAK